MVTGVNRVELGVTVGRRSCTPSHGAEDRHIGLATLASGISTARRVPDCGETVPFYYRLRRSRFR